MNRMKLILIALLAGTTFSVLFTGCATIYNDVPIYFDNTTPSTTLTENGKKLDIEWVVYTSSGDAVSTTIYSRKGIKVPRSKEDRHLTIERDGKKADFTLETKFATAMAVADFWLGGVGLVVDLVKGPLRTYKVKNYDVNQLLGEEPIKN